MIFDKRRKIRKPNPAATDWQPTNFVEEYWGEIRLHDAAPIWKLVLKALVAGIIGYWLGALFFTD